MTLASFGMGQSYWKRAYGGQINPPVSAIVPISNGNIINIGVSSDLFIFNIKPNGDTLWAKFYPWNFINQTGDTIVSGIYSVTPDKAGNLIALGSVVQGETEKILCLLKIDLNGNILWLKRQYGIGVTSFDFYYGITATQDGNFIVVGTNDQLNVFLLKINSDGDTIWTKTFNDSIDFGHDIVQTPDGNFLVVGSSIRKINSDGSIAWKETYQGDFFNRVLQTKDGNFIAVGSNVIKINSYGDTIWTKKSWVSNMGSANAIAATQDGNYLIVGGHVLTKFDSNGRIIWSNWIFNTPDFDLTNAINISPTADGNFIAMAYTGVNSSLVFYYNWIFSIIDDRYGYKNIPFIFKIPASSDSLAYSYTPLKVPSGMIVSKGGTISWTPATDSVYMDHVEFAVSNGSSINDTLTFNIFVNSKDIPVKQPIPISSINRACLHISNMCNLSSESIKVSYSLPKAGDVTLRVYNLNGRLQSDLVNKYQAAGNYSLGLKRGSLATGAYVVAFRAGDYHQEKIISLMR